MATETVRDVVIGMADGLTVPFALAAGLSAAVSDTSVIVTAGLAEIAAGAIAMGLGGYLAARDAQHFASELSREGWEIDNKREFERPNEIAEPRVAGANEPPRLPWKIVCRPC
jgi:vacuolar iron transporter family protein